MNDDIDNIESRFGLYASRMLSGSNYLVTVVEVLQNNQDLKLDEESPEVIFIIQGHITNQGFFN